MNISINPALTVVGQGLFDGASSNGARQGTAYPSPTKRFELRGGVLASSETLPMWGGVGIYEDIPTSSNSSPNPALGPTVGRAIGSTGSKALAGFSVFDQAYGMINSPNSPVPLVGPSGQVMSYALGCGQRIWLACDPGLVDLQGDPIGSPVAWDDVNQQVIPYTGSVNVASGTYNSTSGLVTLTLSSSAGLGEGDTVTVNSITGSGSVADLNGTFTCGAGTTGSTVTYTIATGLTLTITSSTGTVTTGPALPVKVLDVQGQNCMTVQYNSVTGFATWDYNGSCILLQI